MEPLCLMVSGIRHYRRMRLFRANAALTMPSFLLQVLAFVSEHIQPGAARLAGNSVHVDAAFLRRLMPRLHAHLHHRIVDVSTVAELCTRWYPQDAKMMPRKKVGPFGLSGSEGASRSPRG